MGHPPLGVGDPPGLAPVERKDEELRLFVDLAIDECEPITRGRPFDRTDIATAWGQLTGGAGGDVDGVKRALEPVVGVVGAAHDDDQLAAVG